MISIIKKSTYKESAWKNGNGKTYQIAIYPEDATIAANNFLWRISLAEINQSDAFSIFPNCERQLIAWKGDGLLLNGKKLLNNIPFIFSGEEKIQCDLENGTPACDVGIIYKKDLIRVYVEVLNLVSPTKIKLGPGIHFFFLARGQNLEAGDCLKVENETELIFSTGVYFHFNILE